MRTDRVLPVRIEQLRTAHMHIHQRAQGVVVRSILRHVLRVLPGAAHETVAAVKEDAVESGRRL